MESLSEDSEFRWVRVRRIVVRLNSRVLLVGSPTDNLEDNAGDQSKKKAFKKKASKKMVDNVYIFEA